MVFDVCFSTSLSESILKPNRGNYHLSWHLTYTGHHVDAIPLRLEYQAKSIWTPCSGEYDDVTPWPLSTSPLSSSGMSALVGQLCMCVVISRFGCTFSLRILRVELAPCSVGLLAAVTAWSLCLLGLKACIGPFNLWVATSVPNWAHKLSVLLRLCHTASYPPPKR